MRTELLLITMLLFTHALVAQEREWTQVNGWRYQNVFIPNYYDEDIYIFDKCENELLFLDQELEVENSVKFGEDYWISTFVKFDEFSFAFASTDSYQSFIFRYDENYNVLDQDLVQFSLIGIYRLKDLLLLVKLEGDQYVCSFIEPSSGEEIFSYSVEPDLILIDICVGEELSYLNLGEKVIAFDESIGIVDSFEMNFKINDVEVYSENSISVAGNSKLIYILSLDDYSKIDSIETTGLGIPILPDEVFSHKYLDQRIYVSSTLQMEYSDDGGVTWFAMDIDKDQYIRNHINFSFSNGKYLFWEGKFGIEGFNLTDKSLKSFNALKLDRIGSIAMVNDSTIIATNGSFNSTYREVWKSVDFGLTWYKATEWDLGGYSALGFSYDVNVESEAIHYSPVDSLVYYSDYLGIEWEEVSPEKIVDVKDAFITNSGDYGLVTDEFILVREKDDSEWAEEYSFEANNYSFLVKDNLVNNWIVGFDKIDSSCIIFQYADGNGLSEPIYVTDVNVQYLNFNSNVQGDLHVSTGKKLLKIDAASLEIEEECSELSNFEVLDYRNQDSIILIHNDSLFITETGCGKSELQPLKGYGKVDEYYLSGGLDFFNSKWEWLHIVGKAMFVYRDPLDEDYISTDIARAEHITDNLWIDVFPNPTDGLLYFQGGLDVKSYKIYSIDGMLVKSIETSQVNISDLSAGTYFLVVDSSEGVRYSKVVKL